MNEETALLKAIVAAADEDTPRLAYADWLDENGDPDRAEFIRVQIGIAAKTPSDRDYPNLLERWEEVIARVWLRLQDWEPEWPTGVSFYGPMHDVENDDFRRGFPEVVSGDWGVNQMTPDDREVEESLAGLAATFTATTARSLDLTDVSPEQLKVILAIPDPKSVHGLSVRPATYGTDVADSVIRVVVNAPCAQALERLALHVETSGAGTRTLAGAKGFDRLVRLDGPILGGRPGDVAELVYKRWFRRLRSVRFNVLKPTIAQTLVTGLAKIQTLHSMELHGLPIHGWNSFVRPRGFPGLGRLVVHGSEIDSAAAIVLAGARFPKLAVLELPGCGLKADTLTTLLSGRWAKQLRVASFGSNGIGDRGVIALAESMVAKGLRILRLGDNPFGKTGLAALTSGAFPELTTLDLDSSLKRKATTADVLKFVTNPNLPRLKHLGLSEWPLGDEGAKALAANSAFAGLTRLSLANCGIGSAGADALIRSPHLQNLVEFHLNGNAIENASALADEKWLPRLGRCRIYSNKIPKQAADKITAARVGVMT